jgi:hypothetical protein
MKAIILLAALSGLTAMAQPPQNPSDVSDPTRGRAELRSKARPSVSLEKNKKTSGVVAQVARVRNPLKLIDPRAPRELGDARENVSRDPITGRAEGIRLLTINF